MHAESTNVIASERGNKSSARDAVYIGARASVRISAIIDKTVKQSLFVRWKSKEVSERIAALLEERSDFILGDYPLKKLSNRHASGRVLLRRNGALGDVIVLIPAVRRIKELLPFTFTLSCGRPYLDLFRYDKTFDEVIATGSKGRLPVIGGIELNGVPERDLMCRSETEGPDLACLIPRVFSYFEFLSHGFGLPIAFSPDYSLKTGEQDEIWAKRKLAGVQNGRPIVLVQARGSGQVRSLGRERMIELTRRLAKEYTIVVSDQSGAFTWEDQERGIYPLHGRSALNVIAFLRKCAAVVAMDSGTLWLAHVANVPTVAILGPTRESERLATHGLYPERARAVNAAALFGCSPCFESAVKCKRRHSCLHELDINILAESVSKALSEVLRDGTR